MLRELLRVHRIRMDEEKIRKLEYFVRSLMDAPCNLTSIRSLKEAYLKHVVEVLVPFAGWVLEGTLVDVGSGGGIPAIPLAVAFEKLEVWAVESVKKKVDFLRNMVGELQLKMHVLDGRAEELAHLKDHREVFDYATSRALGKLPVALELMAGFVRKGGYLLLYRGRNYPEERRSIDRALRELALEEKEAVRYHVASKDLVLAVFKKIGALDERYPRRPGVPKKRPL